MASDPAHRYAVYATGFTTYPSLDYYFGRLGSKVRVRGVVRLRNERWKRNLLDKKRKMIAKSDYLILTFTHLRATQFPHMLQKLSDRYELHQNLLQDGRGLMIYRVKASK